MGSSWRRCSGVLLVMNGLRMVRDLLIIFLVLLILTTKISQSWDYWWVALGGSILLMLPDFVSLYQKESNQE